MAIIISQIKTTLDEPKDNAVAKALSLLRLSRAETASAKLYKSSVDARRDICFVNSVYIAMKDPAKERRLAEKHQNVRLYEPGELSFTRGKERLRGDVYVAGFGPAGMFCALTLCEFGYRPVVLERGADMDSRIRAVEGFWAGGALDPSTNVQFGEGGAGTFSDGKLTTRIGDPLCSRVLERLVEFGAPEDILTQAKPHIGTDKLRRVVKNLRSRVLELGGEVRFLSPLENLELHSGRVDSIRVNGADIPCGVLALAVGHSAHDTFRMLHGKGVTLVPKPFSVGARIEHLQADIDRALYGKYAGHPALPPGEYQLSYHDNGRGVYTFCMCPGGFVVPAASGPEQIVVNGMSPSNRGSVWANSGMVVELQPEDFGARFSMFGVLAGIKFQEDLERQCYLNGNCKQTAPAQRMTDFVNRRNSFDLPRSSYSPGLIASPLHFWLPDFIVSRLQEGFKYFGNVSHGFLTREAVMIGVETRTSSPVRIPRDRESMTHIRLRGFYPCGEGAGYAGGIVSAAIDGERCAEALAMQIKQSSSFDRSV